MKYIEQPIEIRAKKILQFLSFRDELLEFLCDYYGITIKEYYENFSKRKEKFVLIRQIIMKIANDYGYSDEQSGLMHYRCAITCYHSKKVINNYIETDKNFKTLMDDVELLIKNVLYNIKNKFVD